MEIPYTCVIQRATLLSLNSGALVVDIWKDTYVNYPPTVADTITGSAKPTITATGNKGQVTTLTGWTNIISAGEVLFFNVDSCSTITNATLVLKVVTY